MGNKLDVSKLPSCKTIRSSKSKKTEARLLSEANRDVVVSQVSVLVPTQGIFSACQEDPELARKFSATIIFETARLLQKYPQFCSIYSDNSIYQYDDINIGYALFIDDGLKVPVFRNANQYSVEDIMSMKDDFIEKYITKTLTTEDLSNGTFTITDLSSSGCFLFSPVINYGQSAILGIGGENSKGDEYPIVLAFDHRVTDGATATAFLVELKKRLIAHENVLLGPPKKKEEPARVIERVIHEPSKSKVNTEELCCDSCFRTIEELTKDNLYLFATVDANGEEKHICSLCAKGW